MYDDHVLCTYNCIVLDSCLTLDGSLGMFSQCTNRFHHWAEITRSLKNIITSQKKAHYSHFRKVQEMQILPYCACMKVLQQVAEDSYDSRHRVKKEIPEFYRQHLDNTLGNIGNNLPETSCTYLCFRVIEKKKQRATSLDGECKAGMKTIQCFWHRC